MVSYIRHLSSLLALFFSTTILAENYCQLSKEKDTKAKELYQSYRFDEYNLWCASAKIFKNTDKLYRQSELKVVRANIHELSGIEILAGSHGYYLTHSSINCDKLHCQHISVIPLAQFQSIKQIKPKLAPEPINHKLSSTQNAVNLIDSSLWLADIVTLSSWSRKSGSSGNVAARNWIQSKMNNLGLNTTSQSFLLNGSTTANIIGVQAGSTRVDEWYIVGAHMDSRPYSGNAPGAIDNASGCAAVLEVARVAQLYNFEATIIYICYSGEEQGLYGSYHHVNTLINEGNQNKVKAALTMDMVGYTSNSGHDLLLETSAANQWLIDIVAQNAASYAPNLTILQSLNPWGSDHVPYINNNMHGILLIDDDWSVYPAYHQANDLPENINLTQGEYILKTNLASLAQLAGILTVSDLIFSAGFEN